MTDIFISYSHQDTDYAHSLAESLKQNGFSVWIDDRINYGTEWPQVIQQNLDGCKAFVVILSPRSYKSDWVQNELAYARAKQKSLFPLLLEGDTWVSVAATQFTDVRDGKLPPQRFFDTLERTLGSKGSVTETLPVPQVEQRMVPKDPSAVPGVTPQGKARLYLMAVFVVIIVLGVGFAFLSRATNANSLSANDQQSTLVAENFKALAATTTQIAANFNALDTPASPLDVTAEPRMAGVLNENDILGHCDDKNSGEPRKTFKAGTPLTIYWVWEAQTYDEVAQQIHNADYTVRVDGTPLEAWQNYRTDITHFPDDHYYVYWFVPIGRPPVGDHSINFQVVWNHAVTDGSTQFGPGTNMIEYTSTCGFTVK